jgi:DNA-binding NtrC family response regulator
MEEKKHKILIIDDEKMIVDMLVKIFKYRGLSPYGAINSQEALEAFRKEKPEICIIDILLHNDTMDGIEILEIIKKEEPQTVCIMFTRVTEDEKLKRASELGVFGYLIKPVTTDEIKKIVSEASDVLKRRSDSG